MVSAVYEALLSAAVEAGVVGGIFICFGFPFIER